MFTPGVNRWGQRLLHFGTSPAALVSRQHGLKGRNATLLPAREAVAALYYQVRSTAGAPPVSTSRGAARGQGALARLSFLRRHSRRLFSI
jgi:hypothetical protein